MKQVTVKGLTLDEGAMLFGLMSQPYLGRKYHELSEADKRIATQAMDGTNFDCNKCGLIILRSEAECMMGGTKESMPSICYEYGAVCKDCWNDWLALNKK